MFPSSSPLKRETLAGSLSPSISMCGTARTERNITDKSKERARGMEHRPPNVTARSVAATTDIDLIGTPLRADEDLYRANPSRIASAE